MFTDRGACQQQVLNNRDVSLHPAPLLLSAFGTSPASSFVSNKTFIHESFWHNFSPSNATAVVKFDASRLTCSTVATKSLASLFPLVLSYWPDTKNREICGAAAFRDQLVHVHSTSLLGLMDAQLLCLCGTVQSNTPHPNTNCDWRLCVPSTTRHCCLKPHCDVASPTGKSALPHHSSRRVAASSDRQ